MLELSCLHENELTLVERAVGDATADAFERVSVHGPAKGRQLPEHELVGRLDALGHDVVMHPDVFEELPLWRALGRRLLIENNDGRKLFGQTPDDLDTVFDVVSDAGFCLDVSHALDAGGQSLVVELATRYDYRLVQLHAGCSCGHPVDLSLGSDVVSAVEAACAAVGRALPVVLERATPPDASEALSAQLEALATI